MSKPFDSGDWMDRMPFRPKYGRVPIPRHILESYVNSNEAKGRKACEHCGRYEGENGVTIHEGWCPEWGCPDCGGRSFTSEGTSSTCDRCGRIMHDFE